MPRASRCLHTAAQRRDGGAAATVPTMRSAGHFMGKDYWRALAVNVKEPQTGYLCDAIGTFHLSCQLHGKVHCLRHAIFSPRWWVVPSNKCTHSLDCANNARTMQERDACEAGIGPLGIGDDVRENSWCDVSDPDTRRMLRRPINSADSTLSVVLRGWREFEWEPILLTRVRFSIHPETSAVYAHVGNGGPCKAPGLKPTTRD